jgi:hypothetical protein
MAWPRWRHTLNESRRLAVKAVDEYNSSTGHYADFIGTMIRAWLYLLQAEFQRDKTDDRYRNPEGKLVRLKGGEHKRWDVTECVHHAYPQENDPVRVNLKLFILLRNKVEHRFEQALKEIAGGKAHALVINYERRPTEVFGAEQSLGDKLRFPIFVESITATAERRQSLAETRALRAARTILSKFDADLDPMVLDDTKYDYRVRLVPTTASQAASQAAVEFVNLDAVTDEQRQALIEAGRTGAVITKPRLVPVASKDDMLPKKVVAEVDAQVPYKFTMGMHTAIWKKLKVRPEGDVRPGVVTDDRYCLINGPTNQYVYTPAWVKKVVREVGTAEKFEAFFGYPPGGKRLPSWPTETAAGRQLSAS